MGKREGIVRARRGAVLAEFAIAFMPICTMFLCVAQLSRLFIARLAVLHAAEVSVRACAVIQDPDPGHADQVDGPDSDVQRAAHLAMKPFGGDGNNGGGHEISITDPTCSHVDDANGGTDTVQVNATYYCTIPVAQRIVCSGPGSPKTWTVTTQFPHQGANYEL